MSNASIQLSVEKLSERAKFKLTSDETTSTLHFLNQIMSWATELAAIDTNTASPRIHALSITQHLREDRVTEVDQHDVYQNIAPQAAQGFYLVPLVIE